MFIETILKGKRILVTGGGSGLGKEMASEYARLGAQVFICGRRESVLNDTVEEITTAGGIAKAHVCDIRAAGAVDEMIDKIWLDGGPLTGLVNNAAGNFISPTKDLSTNGFDAISNIVFKGSFYVTHACGKRWIEEKTKASVISILTTWVWNGGPYTVPSAMSKAGINIMTKSLAAEWGKYGIRLNAISPGPFPTKGAWDRLSPDQGTDEDLGNSSIPMGRNGWMSELRNLATFLMADGCEYLTGQNIAIDGAAHLASGGNFYQSLDSLTDADWSGIKEMIKSSNEVDKSNRSN